MTSISDPVALHSLQLNHCWIPMHAILKLCAEQIGLKEISRLF
jgi:hypothetical protein